MEIKLFGKKVFEFRTAKRDSFDMLVSHERKESKYLPDFHSMSSGSGEEIMWVSDIASVSSNTIATLEDSKKVEEKPVKEKKLPTPKEIFKLQTLNDGEYELKTDDEYVDAQLESFKDKLTLISSEEYDMRRGVTEITSIVMRLENRKKYPEHKEFYETFAYTTSSKINALLKEQEHLKLGQVAQFLADMPAEAVKTMKDYNKETEKLCGKQAVFYIIADKKDFKKSDTRRDPILLAQSPFAHAWQILGAWDEEMIFLEQL